MSFLETLQMAEKAKTYEDAIAKENTAQLAERMVSKGFNEGLALGASQRPMYAVNEDLRDAVEIYKANYNSRNLPETLAKTEPLKVDPSTQGLAGKAWQVGNDSTPLQIINKNENLHIKGNAWNPKD